VGIKIMNWEAIGAIGEIAGALAVVGSLLFLASQIRLQNRESRAVAIHEISTAFRESITLSCDPAVAEILTRGNLDFDALLDSEKLVVIGFTQRVLRVWEEAFHQHNDGRLSEKIWSSMVKQYAALMSSSNAERVWILRKEYFDPSFCDFVDSLERTPYSLS
jgi:hypothetical protein